MCSEDGYSNILLNGPQGMVFAATVSFNKDDGYSNKNVSSKYNLSLSQVFRD